MGLHDSFQVETSKIWILIDNIRYKHLLKFQTRRGTPVSFFFVLKSRKIKKQKKRKNFKFLKFREKCSISESDFQNNVSRGSDCQCVGEIFFFLELTWKKIALCVQFWKLFLLSSRLPQMIRLPWMNLGFFFFPTFCFMHPKNQSKNTITFFQ